MEFKALSFRIYRCIQMLAIGGVAIAISLLITVNPFIAAKAEALGITAKPSIAANPSIAVKPEALGSLDITVYRDPDCSCCGGWIDYLATEGFNPKVIITADMETLKQQQGVPSDLASCHTAVLNNYVIEGHVPAGDIKRLLAEHPQIKGIAVPGMPIGTPGMESGEIHDTFSVISFDQQGKAQVFSQH